MDKKISEMLQSIDSTLKHIEILLEDICRNKQEKTVMMELTENLNNMLLSKVTV